MKTFTLAELERMRSLRPGPLRVYAKSGGGFRVINDAGDAELGDWNLAECWWLEDAEAFARVQDLAQQLHAALVREQERDAEVAKLREAVQRHRKLNAEWDHMVRYGRDPGEEAETALAQAYADVSAALSQIEAPKGGE